MLLINTVVLASRINTVDLAKIDRPTVYVYATDRLIHNNLSTLLFPNKNVSFVHFSKASRSRSGCTIFQTASAVNVHVQRIERTLAQRWQCVGEPLDNPGIARALCHRVPIPCGQTTVWLWY